ncbi:MAG: hypothetical protein ACOC04_00550 [Halothece sp.]
MSQTKGCLIKLAAIAAILAAGGVMAGGIWLGITLILDPDGILWLNRYLPEWTHIPISAANPPQTLADIEKEVGLLRVGDPIPLGKEILLPLWQSSPREEIVELRIYQPVEVSYDERQYYRLLRQLRVKSVQEYEAIAALPDIKIEPDSLPLTQLSRFQNSQRWGYWINLSGTLTQNETTVTYGQVFYYNPNTIHFSKMLEWTSPTGEVPVWQEVTGDETPELVINHTTDIEPKFKVYQLRSRNFAPAPVFLEEVTLNQPPLNLRSLSEYREGLNLSENGLWTLASNHLEAIKRNYSELWENSAQAQLDVINLHRRFTESQCQQSWASPFQQLRVCLIDGQWQDALTTFKTAVNAETVSEVQRLLKNDYGRVWKRLEATLEVDAANSDAKALATLFIAAQRGRKEAITWLEKQPNNTPDTLPKAIEVLDQWEMAIVENSAQLHISKIIGTAQPLTTVNPNAWLQPTNNPISPQLRSPKLWYRVEVRAFHDGNQWQNTPFSNLRLSTFAPGRLLWRQLGLELDPRMQITVFDSSGQQQSIVGVVKGVQLQQNQLALLVEGYPLPTLQETEISQTERHPLAYTQAALNWLDPGTVSLSNLNAIQPEWVGKILPILWQHLETNQYVEAASEPSLSDLLDEMGAWLVQPIDLTGNNQPEAILTLYENSDRTLKQKLLPVSLEDTEENYQSRTLIFSDQGEIIYSEFSQNREESLTAIADLGDGKPTLIIDTPNNYTLKRWSSEQKRFN